MQIVGFHMWRLIYKPIFSPLLFILSFNSIFIVVHFHRDMLQGAFSTGNLPVAGMLWNSVARLTDWPMTSAFNHVCKTTRSCFLAHLPRKYSTCVYPRFFPEVEIVFLHTSIIKIEKLWYFGGGR